MGGLENQTRTIAGLLGSKMHTFSLSGSRNEDEDYRKKVQGGNGSKLIVRNGGEMKANKSSFVHAEGIHRAWTLF